MHDKKVTAYHTEKKSPGGESNTRSPDFNNATLQSGALNQLGYREKLMRLVV